MKTVQDAVFAAMRAGGSLEVAFEKESVPGYYAAVDSAGRLAEVCSCSIECEITRLHVISAWLVQMNILST